MSSVKNAVEIGCFHQSLTFFLSLMICFVGVAMTGCAAITLQQINELDEMMLDDHPAVMNGLYAILATGFILTFIGFCGCCGSMFENYTMLKIFECCGYDSPNDWMKMIGVPAYAAYCTEDPLSDLTKSSSKLRYYGNGTGNKEIDELVDPIKELSRKKTHTNPCRNIFVGFARMMVATIIVVFLVELIVLFLSGRLIYKIKRKKSNRNR